MEHPGRGGAIPAGDGAAQRVIRTKRRKKRGRDVILCLSCLPAIKSPAGIGDD